jgi:hypothetical protein
MATRRRNPLPTVPMKAMALFILSIPLMVLAVALGVLPLIGMSHADHRRHKAETISRSRRAANEVAVDERTPVVSRPAL